MQLTKYVPSGSKYFPKLVPDWNLIWLKLKYYSCHDLPQMGELPGRKTVINKLITSLIYYQYIQYFEYYIKTVTVATYRQSKNIIKTYCTVAAQSTEASPKTQNEYTDTIIRGDRSYKPTCVHSSKQLSTAFPHRQDRDYLPCAYYLLSAPRILPSPVNSLPSISVVTVKKGLASLRA